MTPSEQATPLDGRALSAYLGLSAIWGASFLFIRIAAPVLGPFPLMAGRVTIAALVLGIAALVMRERLQLREYWGRLLLLGLVHAAIPVTLLAYAELHLTASMAAVAFAVQPLFTVAVSAAWQGERPDSARITAFLLGLTGVAVLVGWGPDEVNGTTIRSVIAVLLSTLSYAIGAVFVRRKAREATPFTLAFGQQLGAMVWLVIPAFFLLPSGPVTLPALGAMTALGVTNTALAFLVFFWLLPRMGAIRAATITYLIPVFGVFWGWLFLDEALTPGVLGGLGLILLSLWIEERRG